MKKCNAAPTSEIRTITIWGKKREQRIYPAICQKKFCHCATFDAWQADELKKEIKNA